MKKQRIISLSREHKEVLNKMQSRPEHKGFLSFLGTQKNNIGILQWTRVKASDPDIAIKKARYEGKLELIDLLMKAFEASRKEDK